MKYSAKDEHSLMSELWDTQLADDPYKFVMFNYPWGKKDTPLENFKGPRNWQRAYLEEVADHLKTQRARMALDLTPEIWKKATASGRGPGKSALVAWLSDHMRTTVIGSTTIVTANTEPQLKSRTFAEITRWGTLARNAHWWEMSVLSVRPAKWFKEAVEKQLEIDTGYYYVQGQLWSEENPDAFAGVHNQYGVRLLMDEGSGIPNNIFNVSEGFFTDPTLNRFWDVFSNPRRNSGAFHSIFHTKEWMEVWRRLQLDARTVEGLDQSLYASLIRQHGVDSDTVRIEVLGQFPITGQRQFISNNTVHEAQSREHIDDAGAALVMGVDIARFGDDYSVARFRQGRDGRSIPPVKWKGADTVQSADTVAHLMQKYNPDAVFIDSGAGTGVIDILRSRKFKVIEVFFGAKAEAHEFANKRTEMYARARDWLPGGTIDADPLLFGDLTMVDYDYYGKAKDQIILESKDILKGKIGRSPDDGDAFALTFAQTVARRDLRAGRSGRTVGQARDVDYPIFG